MMAPTETPMAASHKLSHLLQLADQGPALRAALAEEVAELLCDWPAHYPHSIPPLSQTPLPPPPPPPRRRGPVHAAPEFGPRVLPRESASRAVGDAPRHGGNVMDLLSESLGV